MNRWLWPTLATLVVLSSCDPLPDSRETDNQTDLGDTDANTESDFELARTVQVTLDGVPVEGALVMQGGTAATYRTGPDGSVAIMLDPDVPGDVVVIASHPEARVGNVEPRATGDLSIELIRYNPADNDDYVFRDPGEPDRSPTTNQCGHCHRTITEGWVDSAHRGAASNPRVHDLYAGAAAALDRGACVSAGGTWTSGPTPGSDEAASRCYVGAGTLPDLDDACDEPPCAETSSNTGGCAACHAPGINGRLSSRGLLEARDFAFDYGVHCDVCHKVEAVELDAVGPGVEGRLHMHRPSEPFSGAGASWRPLYFGPNHDSPNAFMGSVQRDHYANGELCAGCHEYDQAALVPGTAVDTDRWPDGRLPVHSTWTEWEEGPLSPDVACNACHMPPAPWAMNTADLQEFGGAADAGVTGGFVRPPGSVRQHTWVGPSLPDSGMLQLSAALDVEKVVSDGVVEVRVTTTNVGAGHRIPTGEPSRAMVLRVSGTCDGQALKPLGGDVVPLFVGAVATGSVEDLDTAWPGAGAGDRLVALKSEGPLEYAGFGPFGDGTFGGDAKGLIQWSIIDAVDVVAVDGGGRLTLEGELDTSSADSLVLTRDNSAGERPRPMAGQPGFAFARVLSDDVGTLMAPHHRAVDVVSDNRLAPHQSFTTTHRFASPCSEPVVTASLRYRRQPAWLVEERGWDLTDELIQEVTR